MDKSQALIELTNIGFFLAGAIAATLLHYITNLFKSHQVKVNADAINQYLARQNIILLEYVKKILTLNPAWVGSMTIKQIDQLLEDNLKWVVKDE